LNRETEIVYLPFRQDTPIRETDMHLLSHTCLDALYFSTSDLEPIQALAEYRGKQKLLVRQNTQVLEGLRCVAMIESDESSNRFERITAPLVQEDTLSKNRAEHKILTYRDVLNLIHGNCARLPCLPKAIRQFHEFMMHVQHLERLHSVA